MLLYAMPCRLFLLLHKTINMCNPWGIVVTAAKAQAAMTAELALRYALLCRLFPLLHKSIKMCKPGASS